jgi:esterase/lipase superfamily enzyme
LLSGNGRNLRFSHLVLAAPDIDADTFRELADALKDLSGRVTVYQSSKDKAIWLSKQIHQYRRAAEPVLIIPGMDTIDATELNTNILGLGHSYLSNKRPLLADIHSVLSSDDPPQSRFGLQEVAYAEGKYYVFRP